MDITHVGEVANKLGPSYIAGENVKWCSHLGKQAVSQNVKHGITIWPSSSIPRYIAKRMKACIHHINSYTMIITFFIVTK